MTINKEQLEEKQVIRYKTLLFMYGKLEKVFEGLVENREIEEYLGVSEEEVEGVLTYLKKKSLIHKSDVSDWEDQYHSITKEGIAEVEKSIKEPEKATENFSPKIIQNFYEQVGAVQNAPYATAYVNQPSGADLSEVFSLIEQLKGQVSTLSEDQREDASDALEAIEEELRTEEPKPRNVKTLLRGLGSTAQGGTAFAANLATLLLRLQELGLA